MSVYNTDFLLVKRAIDSVLNQNFQDFELILTDDGSNNATQHLLLDYAIQHEQKVTYLRHRNCGQSRSMNRAIMHSKGEYISMIDADDEYKPNHLHHCMQAMEYADLIASTTETIVDHYDDYFVPDKYDVKQFIHVDECILFATLFGKKEVFTHQQFRDGYAADAHFYEHASKSFVVKKLDLRTYIYYRNNPQSTCATMKRNSALLMA